MEPPTIRPPSQPGNVERHHDHEDEEKNDEHGGFLKHQQVGTLAFVFGTGAPDLRNSRSIMPGI